MSKKFKFHPDKNIPVHRLPFVKCNPKAKDLDKRVDWFSVPTTGDYGADNEIGKECALAYLKFLRTKPDDRPCDLQCFILSLIPNDHPKGGVIVGFCWELEYWLQWAAANGGKRLDEISEKDIERRVRELLDEVRKKERGAS